MFEKFTEKSIKIMTDAQKIAFEQKCSAIEPEHILLSILSQKKFLLNKLLSFSHITKEEIEPLILKEIYPANISPKNAQSVGFSQRARKILIKTFENAKKYSQSFITPEHIFLALIDDRKSNIYKILENEDFDLQKAKFNVIKLVDKHSKNQNKHPENETKETEQESYDSIVSSFENMEIFKRAVAKLTASNYEILGTEQILQAILEDCSGELKDILNNSGINSESFSQKLKEITNRSDEFEGRQLIFTPNAFKTMHLAIETAKELGDATLKPEHLILGVIKAKSGIAYKIFSELDIDFESLAHSIIKPIENKMPETLTILRLAKQEARKFGRNSLGTEMILLGILGEAAGVGACVLNNLGINLKDAQSEIEALLGFGNDYSSHEIFFTPRAKRVLQKAWEKAQEYKYSTILSQHILWALCSEENSLAVKVLNNLGVNTNTIKQGILSKIGH